MIKVHFRCLEDTTLQLQKIVQEKIVDQINQETIVFMEISTKEQLVDVMQLKLQYECDFIFIVEDGCLIFDLLDLKPLGFVRKQYLEEEKDVIYQLIDYKKKDMNTLLSFHNGNNTIDVMPSKIVYLESQAHYLLINTTSAVFKVREKISDMIVRLAPYGFRQVHRSYIVNEQHLIALTPSECILTGQIHIPLSKKFK